MSIYMEKSLGGGGFVGIGVDETLNALYITPQPASTVKYFPVEHPLQVVIPLLASTALYAEQILWTNNTGRSWELKGAMFRAGTDPSGDCDIDLEHVASAVAPGSGTLLTVTGTWTLDAAGNDTNLAMTLTTTVADRIIPDGSSILVVVESGATTALVNGAITLTLAPAVTAVTFPNVPSS